MIKRVISFAAVDKAYEQALQKLHDAHAEELIAADGRHAHMMQDLAQKRISDLQKTRVALVRELKKWLDEAMWSEDVSLTKFFCTVRDEYNGKLNVCLEAKAISTRFGFTSVPHPVHFREGMAVRNKLRDLTGCEFTPVEYDDMWVELVLEAIKDE